MCETRVRQRKLRVRSLYVYTL